MNIFQIYVEELAEKYTLARVTPFMCLSKRRLQMTSFVKIQFNYRPLIWMCHSEKQ